MRTTFSHQEQNFEILEFPSQLWRWDIQLWEKYLEYVMPITSGLKTRKHRFCWDTLDMARSEVFFQEKLWDQRLMRLHHSFSPASIQHPIIFVWFGQKIYLPIPLKSKWHTKVCIWISRTFFPMAMKYSILSKIFRICDVYITPGSKTRKYIFC